MRDKTIEFESFDLLEERIVKVIREVQPNALVTFHEKYGGIQTIVRLAVLPNLLF